MSDMENKNNSNLINKNQHNSWLYLSFQPFQHSVQSRSQRLYISLYVLTNMQPKNSTTACTLTQSKQQAGVTVFGERQQTL